MPRETVLHDDDEGRVSAIGNELIVEDKNVDPPDPVAIRLRSNNETIGKISLDAFRNGRWREIGRIDGKRDERGRTNQAHQDALELNVWTHIPGRGFEDADYKLMFGIRHDGVVFYGGAPSGGWRVFRLHEDTGRYFCQIQADGNFVGYDHEDPTGTPQPIFDWFSIKARLAELERRVEQLETSS